MITPDKDNRIISTYSKDIEIEGEALKAILRSYELPIRKTGNTECYTRLEIFKDEKPWGNMNYSNPVSGKEEADKIFKAILKYPTQFKTAAML